MTVATPLRIAFLNSWYRDPARGSGTAVAISGLATGIRSLGHEVTLVEPRRAPRGLRRRVAFNVRAGRRLRRAAHALIVGFDLDGLFVARDRSRRYVVSLKGVAADELRFERGLARMGLWAAGVLEGRNARRADRVIVTSRYARDRAIEAYRLPPGVVRVVPEGIALDFWRGSEREPTPPPPTILSVARMYPRKDLATLLAAMPAVREAVPAARLRLVGDGPEGQALRRYARALDLGDAVQFLGAIGDQERVREEYRRATVFCLPSLQEGFGIAFLEAMAAGLPVVAARAGAVPEVVPEGDVGFLVPPRDPAATAAALIRLLRDPDLCQRLGHAGRRRAARFDWPAVARLFLAAALSDDGAP